MIDAFGSILKEVVKVVVTAPIQVGTSLVQATTEIPQQAVNELENGVNEIMESDDE